MAEAMQGPGARPADVQRQLQQLQQDEKFFISRIPESERDWLLERELIMRAWWDDTNLQQRWELGKEPTTPEEKEVEFRLRQQKAMERADQAARESQERLQSAMMVQQATAGRIRGFVVLGIVLALIVTPVLAMLGNVPPEDFSQYVAPVAGIAGTVLGYWFGNREQGASEQSQTAVGIAPQGTATLGG